MATFADMATLLMAFFVLILSFANVNVPKFEQVSGSLAVAFGVERIVPKIKIPMAETLLKQEFTPSNAERTVLTDKSQTVNDPSRQNMQDMTEENTENFDSNADFLEVQAALAEEINRGLVGVRVDGDEVVVELLSPERPGSSGNVGTALSGLVPQEQLEIAKKITDVQALTRSPIVLERPVEGQKEAEGKSNAVDDKLQRIRSALANEIAQGHAEIERDGDQIIIRLGQQDSFSSGSAELRGQFAQTLNRVGTAIQSVGGTIRVEGHTDDVPVSFNDRYRSNWDLSSARSSAVANYIIDNTSLEPGRISVSGFADSKPIGDNSTPDGRARNRRIEVIVDG
tara:strand:- start:824 stop:1846 length:1023 start_codon:yes stop_codon:yes gene_type:complete